MIPILLHCLLVAAPAQATDSVRPPPGFWDRYDHASTWGGFGAAIGGATFLLAYRDGSSGFEALGAGFGGALLGGAFGLAWGANTRTAWDEAHGSFAFDLFGTFTGAAAGGLAGWAIGRSVTGDSEGGGLAILGLFTAPMGAVVAQKALAGDPPRVSVWSPPREHAAGGPLGCLLEWDLP